MPDDWCEGWQNKVCFYAHSIWSREAHRIHLKINLKTEAKYSFLCSIIAVHSCRDLNCFVVICKNLALLKTERLKVHRDSLGSGAYWSPLAWILGTSHCCKVSPNESGVERRYLLYDAAGWNLSACQKVSQLEFEASPNCLHEKWRSWLKLPGAAGRKRTSVPPSSSELCCV